MPPTRGVHRLECLEGVVQQRLCLFRASSGDGQLTEEDPGPSSSLGHSCLQGETEGVPEHLLTLLH